MSVRESQKVVDGLKRNRLTQRLRYDWIRGASHGALSRYFYSQKTYEWLFSHRLNDVGRPVERSIDITQGDLQEAYRKMQKRVDQLEFE